MLKANRHPLSGTFELTGRCNLSCKMCLVRVDRKRMAELNLRERTGEEWIDMARQAAAAGTLSLLLTGGEPMLRPDFAEIYSAISQMGFLVTLYTNATMVTSSVMDVLRKNPPHKIGVTMYGASNETYAQLCHCPDGYDRFLAGMGQLMELPSLLDTRTTIVQQNREDLPAMRSWVSETLGPKQVLHISRSVMRQIRGSVANPQECRLEPGENAELVYSWLFQLAKQIRSGAVSLPQAHQKLKLHQYAVPDSGHYLFEHCGAGLSSYTITWCGRMYACELLQEGYTEPFQSGFQAAWEHLPEQYPRSHAVGACASCKLVDLCEACPAMRLTETGNWFGVPEYACAEAQKMYEILNDIGAL